MRVKHKFILLTKLNVYELNKTKLIYLEINGMDRRLNKIKTVFMFYLTIYIYIYINDDNNGFKTLKKQYCYASFGNTTFRISLRIQIR